MIQIRQGCKASETVLRMYPKVRKISFSKEGIKGILLEKGQARGLMPSPEMVAVLGGCGAFVGEAWLAESGPPEVHL